MDESVWETYIELYSMSIPDSATSHIYGYLYSSRLKALKEHFVKPEIGEVMTLDFCRYADGIWQEDRTILLRLNDIRFIDYREVYSPER